MAKNLLRSVMATSFRRGEITTGNVTKQPVPAHEAITSSSVGVGDHEIPAEGSAADDPRQLCQGLAVADDGDQASPACAAQRPPVPPPHESPLAPAHLDRRSLRFQRSPATLGHMAHHRPQAPSPRNYAGEPDTPAPADRTSGSLQPRIPPIPDPMAAQTGGSAPGFQPGFALSPLQETAAVR